MSWEAIGATSAVVGAIAVIVTLIYVARQLRHSSTLAREDAQYHMLQNQISYYDRLSVDPDYVRAVYGQDLSLEEVHALQRRSASTSIFFKWNWEYLRFKEGIYGSTYIPAAGFKREFFNASLAMEWEKQKHIFHPTFLEFIEAEIVNQSDNT